MFPVLSKTVYVFYFKLCTLYFYSFQCFGSDDRLENYANQSVICGTLTDFSSKQTKTFLKCFLYAGFYFLAHTEVSKILDE